MMAKTTVLVQSSSRRCELECACAIASLSPSLPVVKPKVRSCGRRNGSDRTLERVVDLSTLALFIPKDNEQKCWAHGPRRPGLGNSTPKTLTSISISEFSSARFSISHVPVCKYLGGKLVELVRRKWSSTLLLSDVMPEGRIHFVHLGPEHKFHLVHSYS